MWEDLLKGQSNRKNNGLFEPLTLGWEVLKEGFRKVFKKEIGLKIRELKEKLRKEENFWVAQECDIFLEIKKATL